MISRSKTSPSELVDSSLTSRVILINTISPLVGDPDGVTVPEVMVWGVDAAVIVASAATAVPYEASSSCFASIDTAHSSDAEAVALESPRKETENVPADPEGTKTE